MQIKLGASAVLSLCTGFVFFGIVSAKQIANSNSSLPKQQLKVVKSAALSYKFGDLDIQITESEVYDKEINDGAIDDSFLKAQVTVERNGTVIDKLDFDHMQDQGYVAGIFVPKPQPLSDYFLIVKHGDYDGHLLLIAKNGKITNIGGGSYFVTTDKHYVFSDWEEDTMGTGVTVFDLLNNRVVYKTSKKDSAWFDNILQWYKDSAGYFFTASSSDSEDQQSARNDWIFAYQEATNKLLREPARDRLKKAKKIQFNSVDDQKSAVLVP